MLLDSLPSALEDAEALLKRREKAAEKKELWRSIYRDCFLYAMPARETFSWHTEGQFKNNVLYDSTLQEATYTAANTLIALLFPSWSRWAELVAGGAIKPEHVTPDILDGLQAATKMFFDFLNISNFNTVISEAALDLMVGTCSLSFDEGETNDNPFAFSSIPLSVIEIEEGPNGSVETTWMLRKPKARHLERLYEGLQAWDLSEETQKLIKDKPDAEVEIVQGEIYFPKDGNYYGVVIEKVSKNICWRYKFGVSCPTIVARATKVAGETYGRGRVMLALSDARTLDRMQEFVLRHAALQVAPPMTGVSDGVLNPYTASLRPNTIIPVASNDNGSPSLRALDIGGNFNITEAMMKDLRERVRRTMLGPEPSEGAIKSATEINIADRNRLWAMNGEYNRIMSELLAKVIARGVFILQKKGLIGKFKIDGREVQIQYTSPFAKSQKVEDVMNLQQALQVGSIVGPQNVEMGIKVEDVPAWVSRQMGVPEKLIRTPEEVKAKGEQVMAVAQQAQAAGALPGGPAAAAPTAAAPALPGVTA